ncbi:hypothetical protein [Lysinibacter cavernae]|uniref:ABC transporter permease n=1 Tax=Lysinibacter cavernae TaxID=1640652 RepID=A0A7X5R3I4_9MICO|nr:hypothetical protein [Lysinibacter cavernae]NIH54867.1 hypothetical protein [Lysinibacter cavernae]
MFRAELLKLTTLQSTKIAALVGVIGLALTQLLMFWLVPMITKTIDVPAEVQLPSVDTGSFDFQYSALNLIGGGSGSGSVGIALVAILSLGVLAATGDYRWGGMASAALANPKRSNILLSKVGATAAVVALLGAAYALVCIAVLVFSTVTGSVELILSAGTILSTVVRGICGLVLLSLCALAVGILVRSQLAGFLLVIGFITVEPLIQGVLALTGASASWSQFLPLALAQAAAGDPSAAQGVHPLIGMSVLVAVTLALLGIAALRLNKRDL